jgi:hypothetical protein
MASNNKPKPIPGETPLVTSDAGVLSLSNYRVKFDAQTRGASKFVSIPLDTVSSCGLVTRSFPTLLIIAAAIVLLAFTQQETTTHYAFLFVGIGFILAYFVTRAGVITISSAGGESIVVPAKGMSRDQILYFLESVTEAKLKFTGKIRD